MNALGSAAIGVVAGALVFYASLLIERVFKLDDVVGAVAVHGVCGAWGTVAVGIFILPEHLPEGVSRVGQFGVQLLGVAACFVWAFGVGFITLHLVNAFRPLRVSEQHEREGLNVAEHGATSSILDLAMAMDRATKTGDYSDAVKVEVEQGTEVGDLASCFNEMVDAIQHDRQRIAATAEVDRQRSDDIKKKCKLC